MFKPFGRIFEQQGDNGGAGGGDNGGGAGSGAPLTADDVARIANQAVTAQLKRELPKAFDGFLPTLTKTLDERLASFKPADPPAGGAPRDQQTPELAAMQRKLDELTAANKAAEERAFAVERKAREDGAFSELRTALGKHIKPEFVDPIAKSLYYADKRVEFGEDGKPLFKAMVPAYQGGPLQETLLPLIDGVEAFAKSKEAEAYRPPPTTRQPNSPPPRIPTQSSASRTGGDSKIPSTLEDPGWASRMAAELAANGVPNGSFE